MSQQRRKITSTEMLVLSSLFMFGAIATLAFRPLVVAYFLGCILWLVYWYGLRDK